jgi:hypothetical protein
MEEVPADLVSTPWWPRLEQAAATMPVTCHSIFLECHLSDETGRTDLIARFLPADRDAALEGGSTMLPFARKLFARWADPADSLHTMSFVDIEWDVGALGAAPFLCPTLEPILSESPRELEAARQEDEVMGRPRRARLLAHHVLRALYEDAVTEPLLARLDEAFHALPPYGSIHYVNYLPHRHGGSMSALRAIASLRRKDLREFLQRLGFSGDLERAMARVNRHGPHGPWTNVDIDLGLGGLGSRLGIYREFAYPRPTDQVLTQQLGRLTEDGLAPPKRLSALSTWIGHSRRSITFKLVQGSDEQLAVKAYLEIGPGASR